MGKFENKTNINEQSLKMIGFDKDNDYTENGTHKANQARYVRHITQSVWIIVVIPFGNNGVFRLTCSNQGLNLHSLYASFEPKSILEIIDYISKVAYYAGIKDTKAEVKNFFYNEDIHTNDLTYELKYFQSIKPRPNGDARRAK